MDKKMNKFSLFATITIFVVCLIIVTGSTFSLFTSETGINIAVTSGKVDMEARINGASLKLYSKSEEQTVVPEKFANGGEASFNLLKTELTLENVTPGDAATFDIELANNSKVDIAYRVSWEVEGELKDVLKAYVQVGEEWIEINELDPTWITWKYAEDGVETEKTANIHVCVILPLEVGNDYQETDDTVISFKVVAVQANATGEYDAANP